MATVLIVDDEPEVRKVLHKWISRLGHTCLEAGDAAQALDVMAATPADVAFCDIQMPGRDGIWLTSQLRTTYPAVPVVLATAVTNLAPRTTMQAGVMAYLVKPFDPKRIAEALEISLKWHADTAAKGVQAEDVGQKLDDWLDELKEL